MENVNNKVELAELFPEAFLTYAKTVITNRSLPDIAGCKPVHTAILWAMHELNLNHKKPEGKSSSIVGKTLTLHPHGDTAAYEAAVRLAGKHIMRYPLIESKSSMGGITGSEAASYRYTEMKPSVFADLLLEGVDKNAVVLDSGDTGNPDIRMPQMMPGAFPNILVNGNDGIAVGLACSWLPHNLGEVVDGINAYIDNKDIDTKGLMEHIKGPDFPLGGTVLNKDSLLESYENGRSKETIKIRGDYTVKGRKVHFSSIPYGTNVGQIIKQINTNVDELSEYIEDYENDTSKEVDLTFIFKTEELVEPGLNVLFRRTNLQHYASINMNLKVGDGFKEEMSLKEVIEEYVNNQVNIIKRTHQFDLEKAKEKEHLLEGQVIVLADIDEVVKIIRGSKNTKEARVSLEERYSLSEIQSKNVLSMRLSKLTSLEIEEVKEDLANTKKEIIRLKDIIDSKELREEILKKKLIEIKENHGDARRTKLENIEIKTPEQIEEITPPTPVKVGFDINNQGIRALTRSVKGLEVIDTKLNEKIVLFSNLGNAYKLDVVEILPSIEHVSSFLDLENGEKILSIMPMGAFSPVIMVTKQGRVKRLKPEVLDSPRRTLYIKLEKDDEVVSVCGDSAGINYISFISHHRILTIEVEQVNIYGRNAKGVLGINLKDDDEVRRAEFSRDLGDNTLANRNTVGRVIK